MAAVAKRAKVNQTSLYRRWRDTRLLAGAVAVDRLMRELPVPDTGSLREDLIGWAASVARSLGTRRNVALLRIMTAVPESGRGATNLDELPIGRRARELEAMLIRGRKRGEKTPGLMDILELVLAPIYLGALFMGPIKSAAGVERLVDRALALSALRQ
jgi:AcrR family transcriptional regulator